MKLYQIFQAYDFDEIFPEIGLMYPPARKMRKEFGRAYDELLTVEPVPSKKQIRYQLMHDPDTGEQFYGADDEEFKGPIETIMGKDLRKDTGVELTEAQMVANCLLNIYMLGKKKKQGR